MDRLRKPETLVYAALVLGIAVGFGWGLPGSMSWMADSISPRSCGLGAIVETYWPGHFHKYPPLQMAILTVFSLPWMGLAALRAGGGVDALAAELIKPEYMTGIELSARLVAAAMAAGVVRNAMRLWTRLAGRRAGVAAGAIVATNAVFIMYGRVGCVDVPYVFWLSWALVEIDRVACGEPRETRALLLAAAAVLTKDPAAAALVLTLPAYLVALPWFARRESPVRRGLVKGAALTAVTYAIASGLAVNPSGFRARVAHLFGPASTQWTDYPKGLDGTLALAHDALGRTTDYTSWPIVASAFAGVAVALVRSRGLERARRLLPFVAAVSFVLFFTLKVRQSDHRHYLPATVFFFPYAALAFDAAWSVCARSPKSRAALGLAAAVSLALAALGVASMDATLLADARYQAERYLAALPAGTHVETYGGPIFMPRIPSQLVAVRPGVEPIGDRQAIPGVTDLVDPAMDPRGRDPEFIVLSTELSGEQNALPPRWAKPSDPMQYADPRSHAFLGELFSGALGYKRTVRATCALPWPLECRHIHHSTGNEAWIFRRDDRAAP